MVIGYTVFVIDAFDKPLVIAEPEPAAALEGDDGFPIVLQLKLGEAEHAESGPGLAVFDRNKVQKGVMGLGDLALIEESCAQVPPTFRPGGSKRDRLLIEVDGLVGLVGVHGSLGARGELVERFRRCTRLRRRARLGTGGVRLLSIG